MELVKINDCVVKPQKLIIPDLNDKFKGCELFPEIYPNVFLLAKKKKGKTTVLFNIIKKITTKKTIVIIFSSTVHKDNNMKAIVKFLDEKNRIHFEYTSIFEDGVNQLQELTEYFETDIPETKAEEYEYVIILDDLSTQISDKSVAALMKKNRHFKCKVFISSQYYNDLAKDARLQVDYILAFPNLPNDKLKELHREADLAIPINEFIEMYKIATKDKFNFLYIDVRSEKYRKNFNLEFKINENITSS